MSDTEDIEVELWEPPLSPSARPGYFDRSPYVLYHGERGSGKSLGAGHSDICHCVEYDDALVIIVTIVRSEKGGIWEDLTSLSTWEDGPLKGEPKGLLEYWSVHYGLEWGNFTTGKKSSPRTVYQDTGKNLWVDVKNDHGGISRIMYKSMENPTVIINRIKDLRPSRLHFEEISNTKAPDFFTVLIQQLGRRGSVPAHAQQWIGTCNPSSEGQKNWVFNYFFVKPHKLRIDDEELKQKLDEHSFNPTVYHPVNNPTGDIAEWNKDYGVHHVKMTDNHFMDPERKQQYINRLIESARGDSTEYSRVVLGLWVPKMTGDAMFAGYWNPTIHLRGKLSLNNRLLPIPGTPIIVGYDPGNVNNARIFLQRHRTNSGRYLWRQFDEMIHKGKKIPVELLVKSLLDRMWWWCDAMDNSFSFMHISDRQALDQYQASGGLIKQQYEKWSKYFINNSENYQKYLHPIHMLAPEKGAGSVQERVMMMQDILLANAYYLSANCIQTKEMWEQLTEKKGSPNTPRKDHRHHIHTFDAVTYPIFWFYQRGQGGVETQRSSKIRVEMVSSP